MKINKYLYLSILLSPMSAYAISPEETILAPFFSFISIVANLGNLMHVVFILVGMYSIYQIVSTLSSNEDGHRAEENKKKLPFYFVGAALGMGSLATSELVQETLFGSGSRSADKFQLDRTFELKSKHLGQG
ncbi:hypothetical protein [Vibrio sp. D431a]|uniref:hypothetical protein n=1 Tax=Vibrio sp. D431a TaxID=2837388 RepID=UPI0025527708|nr:hypothetical protein [Vibrio sp. D431a]MDK9790600.1 hypothetical protein [Vibrio sp. D431a]